MNILLIYFKICSKLFISVNRSTADLFAKVFDDCDAANEPESKAKSLEAFDYKNIEITESIASPVPTLSTVFVENASE